MKVSWGLIIIIVWAIVMMGVAGCAKTERAAASGGRVIVGTKQFIEERVNISGRETWEPDDPQFWPMWQDSQGGG